MASNSTFGYARPEDGAYIAYRVDGDGPLDIVWQPDWFSNIDIEWETALFRPFLETLSSFARVITHDHRGVGLSSRNVDVPTLETRVSDLLAVLRATGSRRPVLVGLFGSGAVNALLAATRPTCLGRWCGLNRAPESGTPRLPMGRNGRGRAAGRRVHRALGDRCLRQGVRRDGGVRR